MSAGHTILVVDDDDTLRESVCDALGDEGYATLGAADGSEALARLRAAAEPPCVIVLDLMMPTMNGWQFRAVQQQDPALAAIPVVVVTAGGRSARSTIDVPDVLLKPVRLDDLLAAVRRYCPGEA